MVVFFFKQKTAYEMRISDWSSDVCSSDLRKPDRSGYAVSALTIGLGSHQSHRRLCLVRSPRSRRQWPHAAAHQTATVNLCPHNAQGPTSGRRNPRLYSGYTAAPHDGTPKQASAKARSEERRGGKEC